MAVNVSFPQCRTECRCSIGILIPDCCVVMMLTPISVVHLWTGHQVVEVEQSSEAPSLFPCCCRTKLGVPWLCFPHSPGTGCGSGQVTEFVAQCLIQPGKFCFYLLLAALFQWSVSTGKTSLQEREETWRVLDLEFFKALPREGERWFHQRFAHNLVYGSQIAFCRAQDKRPEELFSKGSWAWCAGLTGKKNRILCLKWLTEKNKALANLSAAKRNTACGDWQIYVSR